LVLFIFLPMPREDARLQISDVRHRKGRTPAVSSIRDPV
jgi:hypothetical protein